MMRCVLFVVALVGWPFLLAETALLACLVFAHYCPPWALYLDGRPLPMAWHFAREIPIPLVPEWSNWKAVRGNDSIGYESFELHYRVPESAIVDWYYHQHVVSISALGTFDEPLPHAFIFSRSSAGLRFVMEVPPKKRDWKPIDVSPKLEERVQNMHNALTRDDEPGASGGVLEMTAPDAGDEAGWSQ